VGVAGYGQPLAGQRWMMRLHKQVFRCAKQVFRLRKRVFRCDNQVLQGDSQVSQGDNQFLHCDNQVSQSDSQVSHSMNQVSHYLSQVACSLNQVFSRAGRLRDGAGVISFDRYTIERIGSVTRAATLTFARPACLLVPVLNLLAQLCYSLMCYRLDLALAATRQAHLELGLVFDEGNRNNSPYHE